MIKKKLFSASMLCVIAISSYLVKAENPNLLHHALSSVTDANKKSLAIFDDAVKTEHDNQESEKSYRENLIRQLDEAEYEERVAKLADFQITEDKDVNQDTLRAEIEHSMRDIVKAANNSTENLEMEEKDVSEPVDTNASSLGYYSNSSEVYVQLNNTKNQVTQISVAEEPSMVFDDSIISVTDEDIYWMKNCMAAEAQNQGLVGQQAVANVIIHRVQCPDRFGSTPTEVIFQSNAFSVVKDRSIYDIYNKLSPDIQNSVDQALSRALQGEDVTEGALYFRTRYYHKDTIPIKKIGDHYFSK